MNNLQDQVLSALIGLVRTAEGKDADASVDRLLVEGLCLDTEGAANEMAAAAFLACIRWEKTLLAPGCANCSAPCRKAADYEVEKLQEAEEGIRRAKLSLLAAASQLAGQLRALAVEPDTEAGKKEAGSRRLLRKALLAIGEDRTEQELWAIGQELQAAEQESAAHPASGH